MKDRFPLARFALLAVAAGALSACELRREDAGQEDPEPVANPTDAAGTPTPSASASETPTNSIIREDVAPVEVVEEPTEPVELTIPFPDGADVDARAERMLVSIMRSDAMAENWPVVLAGHTDSAGNDQANLRASRARAEAVAAWLVERGVEDDRIQVIAFGEQNPLHPNARPDGSPNELGRRTNRRVEVRIAPATSRETADDASDEGASAEG